MPELRRDPVVGFWTIIATERSRRPVEYMPKTVVELDPCPFCEGMESRTTAEIDAIRAQGTAANGPGWLVRTISSKVPLLSVEGDFDRFGQGLYDLMHGIGAHEVVIESPQHKHSLDELSVGELERVIEAYVRRFKEHEKNPKFKYTLLFKNHGLISGSEHGIVRHTRSQLIATPVTPKRVKEELLSAKNYFERHDRCLFCDILRQESREGKRVVAENEAFLAFCPFASRSPFEVCIVPKHHSADFGHLDPAFFGKFAAILKTVLAKIRTLLNDPPYNFILHTAPYRRKQMGSYWKTIDEDYHWNLQIAPRLSHDAGFEWGTGIYINATPPEDAAMLLRETEV